MLTKEQIANWRRVLPTMGIMQSVLSDDDIQTIAKGFRKRLEVEAGIQSAIDGLILSSIAKVKEQAEHRKKNEKVANQYDVHEGFKNSIKIKGE